MAADSNSHRDIDARVTDLLASPRALAVLAYSTLDTHEVEHAFPKAKPHLPGTELEQALTDPVRLLMTVFQYIEDWPHSDWQQQIGSRLTQHPEIFADLARAVASSPATAWWWRPLDRPNQTTYDDIAVESYRQPVAPDLDLPLTTLPGTTTTSTWIGPLAGTILCGWDGPSGPLSIWHTPIQDSARIYEIHHPGDWNHLEATYTTWREVAADYDGVHLSMAGFLTTDAASNWLSESTIWLHPTFDAITRLPDWHIELPYHNNDWPPLPWP